MTTAFPIFCAGAGGGAGTLYYCFLAEPQIYLLPTQNTVPEPKDTLTPSPFSNITSQHYDKVFVTPILVLHIISNASYCLTTVIYYYIFNTAVTVKVIIYLSFFVSELQIGQFTAL